MSMPSHDPMMIHVMLYIVLLSNICLPLLLHCASFHVHFSIAKIFRVPPRRPEICKPINSSQTKSYVVEPIVTRRTANYESSIWSYDHVQSLSTKYLNLTTEGDFHVPPRRPDICKPINSSQTKSYVGEPIVTRRTANYESSLWSYDHVQSLSTKHSEKDYAARAENLKEVVKTMIRKHSVVENPLRGLELVDDLQRLGIAYHFKEEISDVLEKIYYEIRYKWSGMNLNHQSLGFRLLRQHGYPVTQDIFGNFKDKIENLNPCQYEDLVAILNLYEASYHSFEDESVLDEARDLTKKYLEEKLDGVNVSIAPLVSHALEVPLHWRVPRVEARWFIDVYEKRNDMNPALIELAKLDFDMVQAIHIEDLKHASRWWKNTSWDKKLTFARDRLVECFLWTVGYSYVPWFSTGRREITKVNAMITTIDDVYDVYGTLGELELFTDVIIRWDINAIDELPEYMKICFLGLYNTTNNVAYDILINSRIHVLPYLKKAWADLCESYLREARWYHSGHTPTLNDYLNNACVTIGSPLTLMYMKILTSVTSTEEIVQWFEESKNIVNHTALIVRLADDLATSSDEMERGDISKSIQCYMHESGATEDEARRHIKNLILKTWKKLNKERVNAKSQLLRETVDYAMDIVRMAQFMYGKGDGHGRPNVTKSHVLSLLFNPIQGIYCQ
ncbi:putative R-linalool synthase [Helianthus annuus]|nr:putative R-linalool synthase [Helianthus annuus]